MNRLVVFRLRDDSSVYLADLESGTVEERDPDEVAPLMGDKPIPVLEGFVFTQRTAASSFYMAPDTHPR